MFKRTASRSRKFKIYARSAVAGERESKPDLKDGCKISSRDAAKFNVRHEIPLCALNLRKLANLKFRRKFNIYLARNLAALGFLEF